MMNEWWGGLTTPQPLHPFQMTGGNYGGGKNSGWNIPIF